MNACAVGCVKTRNLVQFIYYSKSGSDFYPLSIGVWHLLKETTGTRTGCSLNNQYWLPGLIYFRATRAANYRSLGLLDFTLPALEVLSVLCVHSTRTAIKAQLVLFAWLQSQIYWYTFTDMHLADAFYPKRLTLYSGYNFFYQYVRYSLKMHVGTMIPTITQHLVLVLESDRAAFKECW